MNTRPINYGDIAKNNYFKFTIKTFIFWLCPWYNHSDFIKSTKMWILQCEMSFAKKCGSLFCCFKQEADDYFLHDLFIFFVALKKAEDSYFGRILLTLRYRCRLRAQRLYRTSRVFYRWRPKQYWVCLVVESSFLGRRLASKRGPRPRRRNWKYFWNGCRWKLGLLLSSFVFTIGDFRRTLFWKRVCDQVTKISKVKL